MFGFTKIFWYFCGKIENDCKKFQNYLVVTY